MSLIFLQITNLNYVSWVNIYWKSLKFQPVMTSNLHSYSDSALWRLHICNSLGCRFCKMEACANLCLLWKKSRNICILMWNNLSFSVKFYTLKIYWLKDGAYYYYCACVQHISRYSDFLLPMLTNTGIFLHRNLISV